MAKFTVVAYGSVEARIKLLGLFGGESVGGGTGIDHLRRLSSSIGCGLAKKSVDVAAGSLDVMLWSQTAPRASSIASSAYRKAGAICLAYDVSDTASWEQAKSLVAKLPADVPKLLVGVVRAGVDVAVDNDMVSTFMADAHDVNLMRTEVSSMACADKALVKLAERAGVLATGLAEEKPAPSMS